jgi:hypothetical protein
MANTRGVEGPVLREAVGLGESSMRPSR